MPATPKELSDVDELNAMMGGTLDKAHALALLRKHHNDLDKAATALLEGDTGAGSGAGADADAYGFDDLPHLEPVDAPGQGPRTPPRECPPGFSLCAGERGVWGGIVVLTSEDSIQA